jgi:probable HAF family extracellular repeat protein
MAKRRACAIALSLSVLAGVAVQASDYYVIKIPTPKGASAVVNVVGLDSVGDLIGNVQVGSHIVPMRWSATSFLEFRPLADGVLSGVEFATSDGGGAGGNVFWDATGTPHVLVSGSSNGVSDAGQTIGVTATTDSSSGLAAIWPNPNSDLPTILPLPSLVENICSGGWAGLCYSYSQAISPSGKYVVGLASAEPVHAQFGTLWVNGAVANTYGGWGVYGDRVNNAGIVVGSFDTGLEPVQVYTGAFHAFRWEAGTQTDLGTLPGATAADAFQSAATAVNAGGVIVGYSQYTTPFPETDPGYHAVLWQNGKIVDLHSALKAKLPANTRLTSADAISDSGPMLVTATNNQTGATTRLLAGPIIPTRISITSNINPSSYGQPIHLVASIHPASGSPPLGNVTWYDSSMLLGTAGLTSIGTASWEPFTWTTGAHNITVVYKGYDPDGPSTSAIFKQTVQATSTKTTLGSSVNPATHGQSFTLTATVVPFFGTIAGSVIFKSSSATLGTAIVDGRTKQARLATTLKAAGKYSITAVFGGTTNFKSSSSAALSLSVK